ncbi:MAG: class I SAM-dependent methyltransferase [Chloroflexota bacterium]
MELTPGLRRDPRPDLGAVGEATELVERIRSEIRADGPMPFSRFMELALYDPEDGYYRSADARPGRTGDFLTAPEAHPIFGRAVARTLADAWDRLGRPDPFVVREHGAGTGALAEAILRGLDTDRPELLRSVRYQAIEIDPRRIDAFCDRLGDAGFESAIESADERVIEGAIVANEVLDALPVHRLAGRDGGVLERYVGLDGDRFVDVWGEPSRPELVERLRREGVRLADGQSAEVALGIDAWVAGATRGLRRGLVLVIDYGAVARELYDPALRRHGTLRAYLRHRVHDDPYLHVGRQDLTAHVDVTALQQAAVTAGLTVVGTTSQAEFLVGTGIEDVLREVQADPATSLESYLPLRSALMRLLDPAAMGRFRVLAFGRDWPPGGPPRGFGYRLSRQARRD